MIRSCSLKPRQICEPTGVSKRFDRSFYTFELTLWGITKHLMTGPVRNSEFCFPLDLNVSLGFAFRNMHWGSCENKTYFFPLGPVIKSLLKGIYGGLQFLPTQMRFPIGGNRVTCRGSKLINSLGWTTLTFPVRKKTLAVSRGASH